MLQMGVKSLHQHQHAEKESIVCDDCKHHKVHSGHLIDWDGDSDECLLCQLFTDDFTEFNLPEYDFFQVSYSQIKICFDEELTSQDRDLPKLRGPPAFIL